KPVVETLVRGQPRRVARELFSPLEHFEPKRPRPEVGLEGEEPEVLRRDQRAQHQSQRSHSLCFATLEQLARGRLVARTARTLHGSAQPGAAPLKNLTRALEITRPRCPPLRGIARLPDNFPWSSKCFERDDSPESPHEAPFPV